MQTSRQRELRWIHVIASVPAVQACKNEKVRKFLWEGVPASVRYIVWAHLTDGKVKQIENMYYIGALGTPSGSLDTRTLGLLFSSSVLSLHRVPCGAGELTTLLFDVSHAG